MSIITSPIPVLDAITLRLGRMASRFSSVRGAGLFWVTGQPAFWDHWGEPDGYTVRMGRLELQVGLPFDPKRYIRVTPPKEQGASHGT